MKQYIEFKKKRDLGEILSDTFAFIRAEFKPFFSIFFKVVGPFLAVMLICSGFYMYLVGDIFNFTMVQSEMGSNPLIVLLVALVYGASVLATYVMSQAMTLFYIQSYANNKGATNSEEIKRNTYGAFWDFIGLGLLVGLCVGVGFMFCLIPGIYLYVPLSLSFSILVFNRLGVSEAFSYSFKLVKEHWWNTFACLIVVAIIVTVASYAFALPATVYSLARMGLMSGEVDAESFSLIDPVTILLNMVGTLAQFLLNVISVIASVFIYFDLNEKKNFTGTYERIKNLGGTTE